MKICTHPGSFYYVITSTLYLSFPILLLPSTFKKKKIFLKENNSNSSVCPVKIEKHVLIQQVDTVCECSPLLLTLWLGQRNARESAVLDSNAVAQSFALGFSFLRGEVCWHIWQVHWVWTAATQSQPSPLHLSCSWVTYMGVFSSKPCTLHWQ